MLQNHCEGINFSLNNQKKTQKISQTCHIFLIWLGIECRNHKHRHAQNLPILSGFSREACLGRIKYLPLLAFSYSGIPVKKFYYLSLWQITSKLNLTLIIAVYQYVS